jgi:D-sedoheptulose 7-phosphate isomerase
MTSDSKPPRQTIAPLPAAATGIERPMTTTIDVTKFWKSEFDEHLAVMAETHRTLKDPFTQFLAISAEAVRNGNKIMLFGNGGSAADAQHLATELAVRYKDNRAPIAAMALTTDTSALTAIGNDLGFQYLFSRQIAAIGRPGDIAVAISTSGNSANVLEAVLECQKHGITTVGFTGKTGGRLAPLCDILLNVPSTTTARIQEMHIMLGQMFCGALELELGLIAAEQEMAQAARTA